MCNCSKQVTETECTRLKKHLNDPEKRFFIYHIFDDKRGLKIAQVPPGKTPNEVAIERGFINESGNVEWFHVSEHPCLYE